tara:strand:+ start:5489 stop:6646 length:1158 start_codon:yes stop_codon:yes gene_type:complete
VSIDIAIEQAKVDFILDTPKSTFLTSLLCSVPIVVNDNIPTLRVNPFTMEINSDFFLNLKSKERKTVLAHEVMHLALQHCDEDRLQDRDPGIWNQAGDYVINQNLKDKGYEPVDGWLQDDRFRNQSTEEVYAQIENESEKNNSLGLDIDMSGGDSDGNEEENAPSKGNSAVNKQLEKIILKAAIEAEMSGEDLAGQLPSSVLRKINAIRNPVIPWQELLMQYMLDYDKSDYSMSRPNKRFLPNYILPSMRADSLGNVAFICDASGSIGQKEFEKFYSEGFAAREQLNPEKFTIASFDTRIQSVYELHRDEYMDTFELRGGGGTAIGPVLEFIQERSPDVTVVFTDGHFWDREAFDSVDVETPVIWLIDRNPNFTAPIGDIIHFVE